MRSVVRVVVSVVAGVVMVGCTSPQEPLPGLTAAASVSAAPTPTPSPTIKYSDPELGIVFEDDTELSGDEAEVYHWVATLETEYWRTLTTNTVSPKFSTIASPEIQARMEQMADKNASLQGAHIGGVFRVQVRDVVVDGESARAVACLNYVDATFSDPNGSYTPEEAGFGGISRQELTLARVADKTWIVQTRTAAGEC